jgi:hypothetical protein
MGFYVFLIILFLSQSSKNINFKHTHTNTQSYTYHPTHTIKNTHGLIFFGKGLIDQIISKSSHSHAEMVEKHAKIRFDMKQNKRKTHLKLHFFLKGSGLIKSDSSFPLSNPLSPSISSSPSLDSLSLSLPISFSCALSLPLPLLYSYYHFFSLSIKPTLSISLFLSLLSS